MADRNIIIRIVFITTLICIISAYTASGVERRRRKRDVDDDAVTAALSTYTSQLLKMERRIVYQEETMSKQKRRILFLKQYLRSKGDHHERDDLQSKIETDIAQIKEEAKLPELDHFIKRLDARQDSQEVLKTTLDKDGAILPIIRRRVLDNKAICRRVVTHWRSGADALIGGLSEYNVECKKDEFIHKFVLERESGTLDSNTRYRYTCCRFNLKDNWEKPSTT